MLWISGLLDFRLLAFPMTVVSIGNFDGVHLGHRRILQQARQIARERHLKVTALTFDPHPATVLRPGQPPPRLTHLKAKTAQLRKAGADKVVVLPPSLSLLSLEPDAFVKELCHQHQPKVLVEGPDFRFGRQRAGDVHRLSRLGRENGFETIVVEAVEVGLSDQLSVTVSSSLLRWLIARGRVRDATRCLGRQYQLTGPVTRGQQRGRSIGVPTANLQISALSGQAIPAEGVYAGFVELPSGAEWPAAISVGRKPTFEHRRLSIEAHLLDYDGDLYNQKITIRFARWLRDQQVFAGVEALKSQLQHDIHQCRTWHAMGLTDPPDALRTIVADQSV